jgi:hypothetical protein
VVLNEYRRIRGVQILIKVQYKDVQNQLVTGTRNCHTRKRVNNYTHLSPYKFNLKVEQNNSTISIKKVTLKTKFTLLVTVELFGRIISKSNQLHIY